MNRRTTVWVVRVCTLAFAVLLVRTAWVSDDAYISFRSAANWVDGHGLRFNVAERVQAFTNPLWTLLTGIGYALSGEVYFTALALSAAASLTAFALLLGRAAISRGAAAALLAAAVLAGSRAFVDYSTSGLENPLAHLLLVLLVFAIAPGGRHSGEGTRWRSALLLAGLALVNRLDAALLMGPLLAAYALRTRSLPRARDLALGFAPLALWLVFATFYYGSPLPNTAHAKLAGMPVSRSALIEYGGAYLLHSLRTDPVTVGVLVLVLARGLFGLVRALLSGTSEPRSHVDWFGLGAGLAVTLHLGYVVWVGGDFMAGRFLAAPFAVAVAAMVAWTPREQGEAPASPASSAARAPRAAGLARGLAAVAVLVLAASHADHPLRTGADLRLAEFDPHGVTDERAFYYPYRGLLRAQGVPLREDRVPGLAAAPEPTLSVRIALGHFAFRSGPGAHVVDEVGLVDPLLVRMPPHTGEAFRAGHVLRRFPRGYLLSLRNDSNELEDPDLAAYYADLRLVTRAPLFAPERLAALRRHLAGDLAPELRRGAARLAEEGRRRAVPPLELERPLPAGLAWADPRVTRIRPREQLWLQWDEPVHATSFTITLDGNDRYALRCLTTVGEVPAPSLVEPGTEDPRTGLVRHRIELPAEVAELGVLGLGITGLEGDGLYAVGHVRWSDTWRVVPASARIR